MKFDGCIKGYSKDHLYQLICRYDRSDSYKTIVDINSWFYCLDMRGNRCVRISYSFTGSTNYELVTFIDINNFDNLIRDIKLQEVLHG